MKIKTTQEAAHGQIFAPGCFDSNIGKTFDVGTLTAVEYVPGGRSVVFTYDLDPRYDSTLRGDIGGYVPPWPLAQPEAEA